MYLKHYERVITVGDRELDWDAWRDRLNKFRKAYGELPVQSGWFTMRMINLYADRYASGDRSEELYDAVMNMKL